ncbi:phage minor tail protein L [Paraburkholderia sp. BR14263]|uniref:phage minor tail protein L n=1 Tax=unclassified Paraburkholderia TaxID=2615204 RepID=UPI0034D008C0
MNIKGAAQELSPGAVIELFVLDLSRFNAPVVRFHAGTNKLDSDVVWQGQTFQRYPVQASGFEMKAQGTLPRPTFVVSNVTSIISALCRMYNDLVGARVIRKRTLARYLDAVNFPEGNPTADPNEFFPDDLYFVNQKVREDVEVIEFELAVAFDVEGVQLPRRQVVRNACPWIYRGEGCGYGGGPVADAQDNPTGNPALDVCGKRLTSCKMRFGNYGWLPFGAFPGAAAYR